MSTDWRSSANCAGMNTNLFYPARGARLQYQQALAVCQACTVRTECLEAALDEETEHVGAKSIYGIRGGVSADRRYELLRARGVRGSRFRPTIEHGTTRGYAAHFRRNDPPCAECRRAQAEYKRERDNRKRTA